MRAPRPNDAGSAAPRRAWVWLTFAAATLVVASAATLVNLERYLSVDEVRMPDLVGMPYDAATQVLRRQGLDPVTFVEYVAGVAANTVSSQSPEAGAIVKRSRTVHLGVNTPPAEARIPDMIGMREADAVRRASDLNLPIASVRYAPDTRPAGTVVDHRPEGGARLGTGERLELVVSSGTERPEVALPQLEGLDVDEAAARLREMGFGRVETLPSAVSFTRPRSVVSMYPAAGATVPPSTPVVLHYALSSATVVSVPEIVGMPQWRAQLALRAAQLRIGQVTYVQDPAQPEGVIDVKPTGYTLPGTPVLLTVNGTPPTLPLPDFDLPVRDGSSDLDPRGGGLDAGPTEPVDIGGRSVPFTFDPTFMGVRRLLEQPYQLRLVISDDRGERTALDRRMDPGEVVSTTVVVYGDAPLLQTYIDEVFFQAWRP